MFPPTLPEADALLRGNMNVNSHDCLEQRFTTCLEVVKINVSPSSAAKDAGLGTDQRVRKGSFSKHVHENTKFEADALLMVVNWLF